MSAGAGEYVMGVLADSSGAPRSGNSDSRNSGFNGTLENGSKYSSGIAFPEAKYYDLYTSMNQSSNDDSLSATACSGGICYGHGLSETAGWFKIIPFLLVKLFLGFSAAVAVLVARRLLASSTPATTTVTRTATSRLVLCWSQERSDLFHFIKVMEIIL